MPAASSLVRQSYRGSQRYFSDHSRSYLSLRRLDIGHMRGRSSLARSARSLYRKPRVLAGTTTATSIADIDGRSSNTCARAARADFQQAISLQLTATVHCSLENCRWTTAHHRRLDGCNGAVTGRSRCGHEQQQSLLLSHLTAIEFLKKIHKGL